MTFVVSESSCHSQRVFDPSKSERLLPCMILIDTFHFSENYIFFFLEKDKTYHTVQFLLYRRKDWQVISELIL